MPSCERLTSINLHRVSLGVDKFSAELDLVHSCGSVGALKTSCPRQASGSKPFSQPRRTPLASPIPSIKFAARPGFYLLFPHRPIGPKFDREKARQQLVAAMRPLVPMPKIQIPR